LFEGSLDELLDCYKDFLCPTDELNRANSFFVFPYLVEEDYSVNLLNLESFIKLFGDETRELNRLRFREKLQSTIGDQGHRCLISEDAVGLIYHGIDPLMWWKKYHYSTKLGIKEDGYHNSLKEVASSYFKSMMWYHNYLNRGVVCWDWSYSEQYAPCLSELTSLSEFQGEGPW